MSEAIEVIHGARSAQGSGETIIVTSCWGEKFWGISTNWTNHLWDNCPYPVEIVSLDGGRCRGALPHVSTIQPEEENLRLEYGSGDSLRLRRIMEHLQQGKRCLQIDLDVMIRRDLTPVISLPYDFVISRAGAFPEFAVAKMGFAGCTGFYVANTTSLPFCQEWLRRIESRSYNTHLDQLALNSMLCEALQDSTPERESVVVAGISFELNIIDWNGVSIAVLPGNSILRGPDVDRSVFGNHHPSMVDTFLPPKSTSVR